MAATVPALEDLRSRVASGAERVLVLGMGGSSLAPLVFASALPRREGSPRLEVLDSTEPETVLAAARRVPPDRTVYVVSSKSGTTLEPNLFFDYFYGLATDRLGSKAGERFVVVTDPGTPLEQLARERGVEARVLADPTIGGRYSALSPFGLVPAALAGIDVGELVDRARAAAEACRAADPESNPGAALGAALGALAAEGRDKVTFAIGPVFDRFGMWAEQLIAESTGKEGKGILPVEGERIGPPEAYGDDRFFVAIGKGGDDASLGPLVAAGQPAARFEVADPLDLGAEMFRWEFATAVAGALLGIDPFDQPNVQEAKDRTNEILDGKAPDMRDASAPDDSEAAARLIGSIRPGDYFAITAYLPSDAEVEARLERIRLPVRDGKKVATTVGFGPRFLHSTGQLHKGGPDSGVFLQLTASAREPVPVPGRSWGFETVVAAQAAGDLAALASRARRALSVHLGSDVAAGLGTLARTVAQVARA